MRANYNRKSSISIKMFIQEFGENFSEHMKERLMDLEIRCFLTRKKIPYSFDLKHVEHLQYEAAGDMEDDAKAPHSKEYCYGQLVVIEGELYFSESCLENKDIMQSPKVNSIYNSLDSEGAVIDNGINLRKIDDNNIDFVVDSILSSCPPVSQAYKDIVQEMVTRANNSIEKSK